MRHLPDKYILIEYQPAGYGNALAICDKKAKEVLIDFSLAGHFNIFSPKGKDYKNVRINDDVVTKDMKEVLGEGLMYLGISRNQKLPPSTSKVLTYRTIAALLSQSSFGLPYWECKSGYQDSSVDGYGQRTALYKNYPEALKRSSIKKKTDFLGITDYNFWFILKDGKPICCLETNGILWNDLGQKINIVAEYKKSKRLWPLIWKAVGHHLD